MKMIYKSFAISLLALTTLSHTYNSQVSAKAKVSEHATQSVDDLRFIGSQTVPYNTQFDDTKVGGISGITYQPTTHRWLLISDDRSEQNPSRFYEAKLNYNQNHFNKIKLQSMHFLKQPNGSNYTNKNHYKDNPQDIVADPESIRFDPLYKQIMYKSEGDRSLGLNPFIRLASLQGDFITEIPISHTQKMDQHAKHGFRNNLALEGSTFSADGHSIWTATEAPLIQDGKSPTPTTEGIISHHTIR
ncbi:esterase-like activity of phytase family protein [Staphylococcus aureus]